MTQKEVGEIIALNKSIFPYCYKDMSKEEKITLLDTWFSLFKDYDTAFIRHCVENALKTARNPVVPADIFEQIRKIESAGLKSEEELWDEFVKAACKANNLSGCFRYTIVEANGRTQGENARVKAQETYDNLSPEIKAFCANVSELIAYGEMDLQQYVKPQFIKRVPYLRERARHKEESKQFFDKLGGFDIKRIGTN